MTGSDRRRVRTCHRRGRDLGVGLAFPTLGAAAAADIADERFGVACAVTSAFRQFGAVLGTAILIAIVGQPAGLQQALDASDSAYLFGIFSAVAAGLVAATIVTRARTVRAGAPGGEAVTLAR